MFEKELALLEKTGFTKGEVRVYSALLDIGSSTVGAIIDKSGVTKSIIYQILEKLVQKGLVSYVIKEKTKYYQPSPPYSIIKFLEERTDELEETKKEIGDYIPQIAEFLKSKQLSQATIYEGFKGIITVHDKRFDKLQKGDEYFFFGLPSQQPEYFHAYWQKDHKKREKLEINCKLLYNQKVSDDVLRDRNKYKGCDARKMPVDVNTPAWIFSYKNVTVIGLPLAEKPLAFEIVNQEVANSFKEYFNWFWKKSKPF